MVQSGIDILADARLNWSRVLAFAWGNEQVLNDLRKDPKTTIIRLANSQYTNVDVDVDTADAAETIREQTEQDPGESYRGYLPIPNPLGGLENLEQSKLQELLQNGLTGILRFDENAQLWSEELLAVWNDSDRLIQVRQHPLNNLIHTDTLQTSQYGILPIPDLPDGLKDLGIEELRSFLGDGDNMSYLGGIFLLGS